MDIETVCAAREALATMSALPNRQRRVLGLHVAGYSYAEIGERTGDRIEVIPAKNPDDKSKRAVVGRVLEPGDSIHDFFVGRPVDSHRNPVTYIDDPEARTCACGCGTPVPSTRDFVAGHDQKAVHERITREWGSTLGFIEWFDATLVAGRDGRPDRLGK